MSGMSSRRRRVKMITDTINKKSLIHYVVTGKVDVRGVIV